MLYIENLCEFLCQILLVEVKQNATVLMPQNGEWIRTSEMIREIAKVSGKKCVGSKALESVVLICGKIPGKIGGLVSKAFGNSSYPHEISWYAGIRYQDISFKESIKRTECTHIGDK